MMVRSIAMPSPATTSGARSIPSQSGRCAYRVDASTVNAPTVKNSPCARFTMRIIPKMSASPSASNTRIVIELRISSTMMTAVSRLMGSACARWVARATAPSPGHDRACSGYFGWYCVC